MQKTIITVCMLLISSIIHSQNWAVQTNPAVGNIIKIHAVSQDTVYASTTTQILKTVNGGTNWEVILAKPWRNLKGFQLVDPPFGQHRIYTWWHTGTHYYRSINGGITWDSVIVPGGTGYMEFFNGTDDTVYYNNSGQGGTNFYYTTNSGANWYSRNASYGSMNAMSSMHFINGTTGFVNGGSSVVFYHVLLRTTDMGFTWTPEMNSGTDGYSSGGCFQFFPNGVGYHISNKTYKTINNGDDWITLNNQGGGVYSLFMHDEQWGWLGKQNGLLKTTNGCANWVDQNIGVSGVDINSVTFINYNTGWIGGENAHILKTTNGSGVIPPAQAPVLTAPPNNSNGHSLTPLLQWNSVAGAVSYRVQVSVDVFNTTVLDVSVPATQFQIPSGFLNHNIQYYWRVTGQNVGGDGPWSVVWNFRTGLVGINQTGNEIPSVYKLYNNYPNPFNPVTKIKFDIPQQSFTKLIIYDISGKEVSMLVNEQLNPGSYEADFDSSKLPSGVYFYKISSGGYAQVKKMILVK
ncbi:MAG: T9SS type A sorting domain-containing protein [Ignavibacteria bacterium]|nr:T9SS type A sorting domain-containing protein [Ignavibacteria bacterium]